MLELVRLKMDFRFGPQLKMFAFVSGNVFGVHDVCFIESSKKLTAMGKFARWAYVLSPWPAMALTYVGSHHMINMKASEKNATWTYGAAAIPTAGIWGAYSES